MYSISYFCGRLSKHLHMMFLSLFSINKRTRNEMSMPLSQVYLLISSFLEIFFCFLYTYVSGVRMGWDKEIIPWDNLIRLIPSYRFYGTTNLPKKYSYALNRLSCLSYSIVSFSPVCSRLG